MKQWLALAPVLLLALGCVGLGGTRPAQPEDGRLRLEEVAGHSTANDCWVIINGRVYNATKIIGKHPKTDSCIIPFCGKDGTASFNAAPHTPGAGIELEQLYVGEIEGAG
ncbi:MAG: cytochrome b5 domain-containing protein [Candidatus Micrarchaeota archaeon]|nr:cytochrome b5 domain-containing protein [Candidatus Micrarchaeota archaeon]